MKDKDELVVSAEQLKQLFKDKILKDTPNGWFYNDTEIQIIALHDIESKYLQDIVHAEKYKLIKVK